MADLVRCAATCRRWRRLVSGDDAAFICSTPRRHRRFLRSLALGFFHQDAGAGAAPRFPPTAYAARLLGLRQPSLNALVEGLDDWLFDRSRLVASRNGLLVVDLRRGKHDRALKLCVCNPMTGEVSLLPPLTGKDSLGHYACTVLTADDHDQDSHPPRSPSAYRLVLVYSRCSFTAFRSYSSVHGGWSPEARVTNARLGKKQMGLTRGGGVAAACGRVVYWLAKNVAFGLHLDTLQAAVLSLPCARSRFSRAVDVENTLLGASPKGKLCAVQIEELSLLATARRPRSVAVRVSTWSGRDDGGGAPWMRGAWEAKELIQVERFLPAEVTKVKLRWFCEKSGVVLFAAGYGDRRSEVYALSLEKQEVEKVASHDGGDIDPWGNLHGYEMDRAAYLALFGEGDSTEDSLD